MDSKVTQACPNCGQRIAYVEQVYAFVICGHCGSSYLAERQNLMTLQPSVVEQLRHKSPAFACAYSQAMQYKFRRYAEAQ